MSTRRPLETKDTHLAAQCAAQLAICIEPSIICINITVRRNLNIAVANHTLSVNADRIPNELYNVAVPQNEESAQINGLHGEKLTIGSFRTDSGSPSTDNVLRSNFHPPLCTETRLGLSDSKLLMTGALLGSALRRALQHPGVVVSLTSFLTTRGCLALSARSVGGADLLDILSER